MSRGTGGGVPAGGGSIRVFGGRSVVTTQMVRCTAAGCEATEDAVAVEEPLEIRVGEERLVVLMRTPGDDPDLVQGFLLTEGLLESPSQIRSVHYCPHESGVLLVDPVPGSSITPPERRFYAASGCGVCGKTSIASVMLAARPVCSTFRMSLAALASLPETLRAAQTSFQATGGLHAAGLFDANGHLIGVREDVGRHNAVDKVIGSLARSGRFPLPDLGLLVSGRTSLEVCQKAAMAGIPLVASVSAPSSLAISLARDLGMTLIGFLRRGTCNVYAGAERIGGADCGLRIAEREEMQIAE